jgi:hypothetical protein
MAWDKDEKADKHVYLGPAPETMGNYDIVMLDRIGG